ncbi:MAG: ABC transporter ATP-binding protein, partial [Bacteroidetes bacterium]|nr:ABC transporter ATP-binding protein [Bacteroidota bacterium]
QRRLEREAAKKTQQEERRRSKKISELEAAITSLELRKSQIEEEMAKPEVYTDGEQIRRLQREADEVSKKIDAAFKEWTSLSEPN